MTGTPGGGVAGLEIEARGLPWVTDLVRERERLDACESRGMILRREGGGVYARALSCGSRICPVCMRERAMKSFATWAPVVQAAVADGAVAYHLTLTQRADILPGALVTDDEMRRGWAGTSPRDGMLYRAVGGEGLLDAYTRFRGTMGRMRENRRTRDLWFSAIGGALMGMEWTGRSREGLPRWHVHAHALCLHPAADADRAAAALDALPAAWARQSGARAASQKVRRIEPKPVSFDPEVEQAGGADPYLKAILEVMKYPFKPNSLTAAMRIEMLAVARGLRLHQRLGGWYSVPPGCGRIPGLREPYRTWYSARQDPPKIERLYLFHGYDARGDDVAREDWRPKGDGREVVSPYMGQDTAGPRWFRWGEEGEPFRADARHFADLLRAEGYKVAPLREPGAELGGLFEDDD